MCMAGVLSAVDVTRQMCIAGVLSTDMTEDDARQMCMTGTGCDIC